MPEIGGHPVSEKVLPLPAKHPRVRDYGRLVWSFHFFRILAQDPKIERGGTFSA